MSSKKYRKKIRSFYNQQKKIVVLDKIENTTETYKPEQEGVKEKIIKSGSKEKWFDIMSLKDKDIVLISPVLASIKKFMSGKDKFIVCLKREVQGKFLGAYIQTGNFNSELEVYPHMDKFLFSIGKERSIKIVYIRTYPDFLPSVSEFQLNEIKEIAYKVEKAVSA